MAGTELRQRRHRQTGPWGGEGIGVCDLICPVICPISHLGAMGELEVDEAEIDYAGSGLTLQQALVAHVKRHPDKKSRPQTILWRGHRVRTSDLILVPCEGILRLEFLSFPQSIRQGVDLKVNGWIKLPGEEQVPLLRTWQNERLDDVVEYPFFTKDGYLWTWNIYEMTYPGGQIVEEKWTENAGFWVETIGDHERVYHCSHGMASPPDFNSLVFKLTIKSR